MTTRSLVPGAAELESIPRPGRRFFSRQPVFGLDEKIFGYELIFREIWDAYFAAANPVDPARSIVDTASLIGYDILCDGKRGFIDCPRDILLRDYVRLLPPAQTVIELPQTVVPDEAVVNACRWLRRAGYTIAIANTMPNDPREPIVDKSDIVMVNVQGTSLPECEVLATHYKGFGCRVLASNIEEQSKFKACKDMGFHLFQGFFFRQPELLSTSTIPSSKLNYLHLLQVTSSPELNMQEVENIIKSEPAFCYRLLRYLNSARFSFSRGVNSVRHALRLLGEGELRRWIRIVIMLGANEGKSSDLVLSALTRGHFCERLAENVSADGSDLFLMGVLSLMDAMLDIPMARVLESIPVNRDIKRCLQGESSRLRPLYELLIQLESGDWTGAAQSANRLRLSEEEVSEHYWRAMLWARQVNRD